MQEAHLGLAHGMKLFYKLENMHTTGSFKERGALNALMNLTVEQKKNGVIAASAGNHALLAPPTSTKIDKCKVLRAVTSARPKHTRIKLWKPAGRPTSSRAFTTLGRVIERAL